ncbi:cytochrome c [Gammaproteobacteria bacterium]
MSISTFYRRPILPLATVLLTIGFHSPTIAAGNSEHGAIVFQEECSDCHSVAPGKNKKGPSLFGVVGRDPAMIEGYNYSDGMRANHTAWTPDRLDAYIAAPKKTVPGAKMKYDGLSNESDRADVIAYLSGQH